MREMSTPSMADHLNQSNSRRSPRPRFCQPPGRAEPPARRAPPSPAGIPGPQWINERRETALSGTEIAEEGSAPTPAEGDNLLKGTKVRKIRVLQVNMNNCREAHDLLKQKIQEDAIDIVLASEPYLKKSYGPWSIDPSGRTGIWVRDPHIMVEEVYAGFQGALALRYRGVVFVSTYLSPNDSDAVFSAYLDMLTREVRRLPRHDKIVIGGDFNTKSKWWNSPVTNRRAEPMETFITVNGLQVGNVGNTPTCVRHNGSSIVDVTLHAGINLESWKVLLTENYSDHRYIRYEVNSGSIVSDCTRTASELGWIVNKEALPVLERALKTNFQLICDEEEDSAEALITRYVNMVRRTCDDVLRKKKDNPYGKKNYWWNEEIRVAREDCTKTRRKLKQLRSRSEQEEHATAENDIEEGTEIDNRDTTDTLLDQLREQKRILRNAIAKSKQTKWDELLRELNSDPWGKGYKIAMRKLTPP